MSTRRTFLQQGSAAVAGIAATGVPRLSRATVPAPLIQPVLDAGIRIDTDPTVHALAMRAIDAANAAGAVYADVRLTRTLQQATMGENVATARGNLPRSDSELYGVGVRALVGGAWGFAASPYWELDEVATLAHTAVAQARENAAGGTPPVDLGRIPVASGSWATPIRIDPFTVPIEEREEILAAWSELARQAYRGARNYQRGRGLVGPPSGAGVSFTRQERAVATTEGAYFTQTIYQTVGGFKFTITDTLTQASVVAIARNMGMLGGGWEIYLDAKVAEQIPVLVAEARELIAAPPPRGGTVGRYDVVFDASSMASIVNATVGAPTQIDRAMGYEANAGGTSYLTNPLAMVGNQQIGSSALTVTANRSLSKGLATVKWDDEGVEPEEFTLVKDGVLADFQTTREQAAWLAPYYQKKGIPVRSHGCAAADSALNITMQHMPNLALAPSKSSVQFDDLIRDTARGLAVYGADVSVDFQGQSGSGGGMVREIVNGRLGRTVSGLEFSFNTSELLKNIIAIGGADGVEHRAFGAAKGQPRQLMSHTVSAVPAKATKVAFIDPRRRV